MRLIKDYEKHAVKAAVRGDEDEAIRALIINPLVGDYNKARDCFQELKMAHRRYLPQFLKGDIMEKFIMGVDGGNSKTDYFLFTNKGAFIDYYRGRPAATSNSETAMKARAER